MLVPLFVIGCLLSVPAAAQFHQVHIEPDMDNALKPSFYAPNEGYVAFDKFVGYTTDSGKTYVQKKITNSNVDYSGNSVNLTFGFTIKGVKAFDKNSIFVYGDYGFEPTILHSTDGGNTFKIVYFIAVDLASSTPSIVDLVFPQNDNIGYALFDNHIIKTTDGGLSWPEDATLGDGNVTSLQFLDDTHGFASGPGAINILKTTDGGNWQFVHKPDGTLNSAYFLNAATGWACNNDGTVYLTQDGGANWTLQNTQPLAALHINKMQFVNDSTGYAIAFGYDVYKTSDAGKVWERLPRNTSYHYLGYSLTDFQLMNNFTWATGAHGYVALSANNGGRTIPAALFAVDTTGLWSTGIVKLQNFSKSGYQYNWFVNGKAIGTSYNISYTHPIFHLKDTITLINANQSYRDTLTQYVYFHPQIIVKNFTPATAKAGDVVTITGANFDDVSGVNFGGVGAASVNVVSSTTITAVVGAGATGNVRVYSQFNFAEKGGFTFIPGPVITSFSPASATAGTTITITGTNFTGATSVTFGGLPAASFTVVSSTQITAVVGPGNSGNIAITSPGGTGTAAGFSIIPLIGAISPASGTAGTILTINGSGFGQASAVTIGGVPVQAFTVDSVNHITAIVGNGATGKVDVTTPTSTAEFSSFTYYNKPVITSFSPQRGPVGTVVNITGNNFSSVPAENNVFFGAVKGKVLSATGTTLTVAVPAGTTYTPLIVETHHLLAYGAVPFTLTFPNGGGFGAQSFSATKVVSSNTGTQPVIMDLDGDGKPDIATLNPTINGISVLVNTGSGGALSYQQQDISNITAAFLYFADMDGDGKPDLVTQDDPHSGTIIVYRNLSTAGNIAFGESVSMIRYNLTPQIVQMLAIDMDGDGKPEIVVTNGGYNDRIALYRNRSEPGKLIFDREADVDVGHGAYAVIADLDGDGKPDVVTPYTTFDGSWYVERNVSTPGNFAFEVSKPLGSYMTFPISLADIDGDGKIDVITDDPDKNELIIFRNLSTTGNISFATEMDIQTGSQPGSTSISDLDGDGKPDIAVNCIGANKISVFKNVSTPGKIQLLPGADYATGPNAGYMSIGDLNGDGKNDLLFSLDGQSVNVLLNNVTPAPAIASFSPGHGVAGAVITISGANFTGTTAVSFGGTPAASFTVNSDKSITAILGSGASGTVSVTNSYDTGVLPGFVYGLPPVIQSFAPESGPAGTTVTITGHDFDPVATKNIVYFGGVKAAVTSASPTQLVVTAPARATYQPISVAANNFIAYSSLSFDLTFANTDTAYNLATYTPVYKTPGNAAVVGDIDGDGKLDMVFQGASGLAIARNTSSNDSVSFADNTVIDAAANPALLYLADINADGKLDIVSLNTSSITIYKNTTAGGVISFEAPVTIADPALTGKTLTQLAITDADGDGLPDIAGTDPVSSIIAVFHNTTGAGTIAFGPVATYQLAVPTFRPAFADIDGDGKPEIITGNDFYGGVCLLKNVSTPGNINFVLGPGINLGGSPAVADLDGDGKPDVIVNTQTGSTMAISRNTSTGGNISFQNTTRTSTSYSNFATVADLNGDGKPDYLLQIANTDVIQVFPNASPPKNILLKDPFLVPHAGSISVVGDMDGDGKPDIIASENGSSGQIIIFSSKQKSLALPDTNFKVQFAGTTCIGAKNGTITVTAMQNLPYTTTITGAGINSVKAFTKTFTLGSLDTGVYNVCITVAGYPGFQQCFGGKIGQPAALSVYAAVDNSHQTVHLDMAGGQNYIIQVNDAVYQGASGSMNIPLQKGNNELTVRTDKDCQGVYKQRITIGNDIMIYPNPFVSTVQMDVGTSQAPAGKIQIVDIMGKQVYQGNAVNNYGKLNLDLSNLPTGVYLVKLTIDNKQTVYKIWKK